MSNDPDLRFAIAINADMSESEIVSSIKELFPDFLMVSASALRGAKNMFVIARNGLYDSSRTSGENGWLYYRYELSVFPFKETTTLNHQRNLANLLLTSLKKMGFTVELICDDEFLC